MFAFAVALLSLLALVCGQPVLTGYAHSVNFTDGLSDGSQRIASYYMLYYTVEGSDIHLGIVADTGSATGWAAFAISQNGAMIGSDAVIGWNDANGVAKAEDFILQNTFPPNTPTCTGVCPDSTRSGCSNQVTAVSGRREGNYLVVEYTRPLAATDPCDNPIVLDSPTFVVYSVGPVASAAVSSWPFNPRQHVLRTDVVGDNVMNVITFTASAGTTSQTDTQASTTGGASGTTGQGSGTTGQGSGTTGPAATTGASPATTGASDSSSEAFVFSLTGLLIAIMMTFGV